MITALFAFSIKKKRFKALKFLKGVCVLDGEKRKVLVVIIINEKCGRGALCTCEKYRPSPRRLT